MQTNADSKLTPQQRKAAEQAEHDRALIDAKVAKARALGPGSLVDVVPDGAELIATKAQLADTAEYEATTRPTLTPVQVHLLQDERGNQTGFEYTLTEADAEAVRRGWYCARCLDLQSPLWAERCAPRGGGAGCGTPRHTQPT